MVFFLNDEVELWEYYEEEEIPNFFGETSSSYKYIGTYPCDFQNMSPNDNEEEYGKILQDSYKIYFDVDVPVTDTMILRRKNHPETYTINGSPLHYHTLLPHIKVNVLKQRKPTDLGDVDYD